MSPFYRLIVLAYVLIISANIAHAQVFERTDSQKEIELGRQVAIEVEKQYPLSKNTAYVERVKRIGDALIANLSPKVYPYQFRVLSQNEINAFCLPGGYIYVYEGLLARMPNDNAVAWVMAHELAHASQRHWHKIVERTKSVAILSILAGSATGQYNLAELVNTLVSLSYSREQEAEADHFGLTYMWQAGYDLQGAQDAIAALMELEKGSKTPNFLRDHPAAKDRLKQVTRYSDELEKLPRPVSPNRISMAEDTASTPKKPSSEKPQINAWFPLEVGNEWTYSDGDGPNRPTYRLRIAGKIPIDDGAMYRAETNWSKDAAVPCLLMTSADRLWRRNRPNEPLLAWQVEAVTTEGAPTTVDGITYTVAKGQAMELTCGRFTDVLKVHSSDGKRTYDMWFARNVGMIKRMCVETGMVEALCAYKVK